MSRAAPSLIAVLSRDGFLMVFDGKKSGNQSGCILQPNLRYHATGDG